MNVLVTGADDIWGYLTAERVLHVATLRDSTGNDRSVESVVLVVHQSPYEPAICGDSRVKMIKGDIACKDEIEAIILDNDIESIFHFETVTRDRGEGEDDFDGMIRVNIFGSLNILEACRKTRHTPKIVFCSSCSVFQDGINEKVSPSTRRLPSSTYGTTKAIVELLIGNYSARDFVDGRNSVLPMCVSWRPTLANTDFLHGVFGAPFDGTDIHTSLAPETRLYFNGFYTCIENLIETHNLDADLLGEDISLIQPGITASVTAMVDAFQRIGAARGIPVGNIAVVPNPERQHEFDAYNKSADFSRALELGLSHEDLDSIVCRYLDAYLELETA